MKTISARMSAAMAALFICVALLAGTFAITKYQQDSALRHLFSTAVEPMRELKIISDRYAVNIVDATHKVADQTMTMKEGAESISKSLEEIDSTWKSFTARPTSAKQAELIQMMAAPLAKATAASLDALAAIKKNDLVALQEFRTTSLYPRIDPATDLIGQLMDNRLEEAKRVGDDALAMSSLSHMLLIGVTALSVLLCAAVALFTHYGVLRPLRRSIGTMGTLADATLADSSTETLDSIHIEGTGRSDEIGAMARTLETFRQSSVERKKLSAAAEVEQQARLARSRQIEATIQNFEAVSSGIVSTVASASAELEASAKAMMETAHAASEQASLVAAASHQTSESVQALAHTGEELAASIGEIGQQAEQSSGFAAKAANRARSADVTVSKLNQASHAIVEVVVLIKTIAAQTNLLALNATIEAARAGDAGRGFAVVASEVKELASQTTRATDVIAEHVGAIQEASVESITAMKDITGMIEEINQVASSIAVAVSEQSQSTHCIAENVQQVFQGSAHATRAITVVSNAATDTGAAATQVLGASEELARQSMLMRENVDNFLHAVRSA